MLRAVHALSWPFGVRSPGLDSKAERHLFFDEVEARYRGSTASMIRSGPMLAAVVVTAGKTGWAGLRDLALQLARWRVPLREIVVGLDDSRSGPTS